MPSTDHMKAVVEAYAAAHTAGDVDAIAALFAADAVVADPVDRPEMVGREAVREFFAGTHRATDGFVLEITGPIRAVDRYAAVPLRAVTEMGGTTLEVDIIDVFTFDDAGLIADMRAYWTASDIRQRG
jgi:steroid delta-isomerase